MSALEGNSGQEPDDLGNLTLDENGGAGQRPILEREARLPHGEPIRQPADSADTHNNIAAFRLPRAADLHDLGLTSLQVLRMITHGFVYPDGPMKIPAIPADRRPTEAQVEELGLSDPQVRMLLSRGFVRPNDTQAPLELKAHPAPTRRADLGNGREDGVASLAALERAAVVRLLKGPQNSGDFHRSLGRRRDK